MTRQREAIQENRHFYFCLGTKDYNYNDYQRDSPLCQKDGLYRESALLGGQSLLSSPPPEDVPEPKTTVVPCKAWDLGSNLNPRALIHTYTGGTAKQEVQ